MRINKSLITLSSGGTASTVPWSGVTGTPTTLSGYGITDAVPSSRTLTINGTSYDLTANRTWSVGTVTSVAMTVPTGFAIGGTPITSSGTLALSFASGYSLPTTASQTNWDAAYNDKINSASVTGTTTKTLTLTQQDGGTITASWTDDNTDLVTSVFGRTGAVIATEGDYSLTQLSDVTITSPSNGEVLKYNGTTWVNGTDTDTGITSLNGLTATTQTFANDTNVTITSATSTHTIGWSGQLAISRGGTGLSALGTANQLLRVNTGATALEYFTPSYLTAAITSLNGLTAATQTFGINSNGTDFTITSGGSSHIFSMPNSSATNRGLLTSTDWTTFNNKFTLPSLTSGSVLFSNGTTIAQDNANLFWDDSNNRLGIGTSSPEARLHVYGSTTSGLLVIGEIGSNAKQSIISHVNTGNGYFQLQSVYQNNDFTPIILNPSGGNIGIGHTNPQTKLSIETSGTQSTVSPIITSQTSSVTYSGMYSIRDGAGDQRGLIFQVYTANVGLNEGLRINSSKQIKFAAYQASTSFSGTPVANLQVDSSGNVITSGINDSGTYTPTLTNVSNVTSSTAGLCFYQRIGNIVNVTGYMSLTPTTNGLNTTVRVSLPIASNFTSATNLHGLFIQANQDNVSFVEADTTNDTMTLTFTAGSIGSRGLSFTFQYEIL